MSNLIDDSQAVVQENADLIHLVIMAVFDDNHLPALQNNLILAEQNGWRDLVAAIRKVLDGERNIAEFLDLDSEDQAIIVGILKGIDNPETLPELANATKPELVGPQLANLVYATRMGSVEAKEELNGLASLLAASGGDLARVSMSIGSLVNGEREAQALSANMGKAGISIIESTLEELERLES